MKVTFSDKMRGAWSSVYYSSVHVLTIERTVATSNTNSLIDCHFGPFIYPMGSIGPYFDSVKILPGEEVCSQDVGSRSLKLSAS